MKKWMDANLCLWLYILGPVLSIGDIHGLEACFMNTDSFL